MPNVTSMSDQQLLARWAPLVRLHPLEVYFPCSVEWYLEKAALLDNYGNVKLSPVLPANATDTTPLADASLFGRENWALNIIEGPWGDVDTVRAGQKDALSSVPCYGFVRPVTDPTTQQVIAHQLEYWMFYAFNGSTFDVAMFLTYLAAGIAVATVAGGIIAFFPVAAPFAGLLPAGATVGSVYASVKALLETGGELMMHEGDWENVVVEVTADGSDINRIHYRTYYAIHSDEGYWTTSYHTTTGDRPIVYSARGSHESYPIAGNQPRPKAAFLADDFTDDSDLQWDLSATVIDVGWDPDAKELIDWQQAQTLGSLMRAPAVDVNNDGVAAFVAMNSTTEPGPANQTQGPEALLVLSFQTDQLGQPWASQVSGASWTQLGAGWSDPDVAINDAGIVAVVYRGSMGYTAGYALAKYTGQASFNPGGLAPTPYLVCTLAPAVALNNNNVIVIATLSNASAPGNTLELVATYQAGVVDASSLDVSWTGNWSIPVPPGGPFADGLDIALTDDNDLIVVTGATNYTLWFAVGSVDVTDPAPNPVTWSVHLVQFGQGQRPTVAVSGDTVVVFAEYSGQLQQYIGTLESTAAGKVIRWQRPTTYIQSGATNASVAAFAGGSIMEVHSVSTSQQTDQSIIATPGRLLPENFDNWQPQNGAQWLKYSGAWGDKSTPVLITVGSQPIREMEPGPTGPAYKDDYLSGP